ncbi:MAG: GyrI-like domain-containing protein [Chitinophagaceae bacterium]
MKFLKSFLLFLLAVAAATAILSFFLPAQQKIERSITINAPAAVIYKQLATLENFHRFSVWSQQDSSALYTLSGTDGTVGAVSSWTGDPNISGDGKIEIVSLEPNKKVEHRIYFSKPKKGSAVSVFTLNETNGLTTVTWNFETPTPRPWNIFNLFYSMDKEMGKDFDYSLATLKTLIEQSTGTSPVKIYEVLTMNFPATNFATIRQRVAWADIGAYYQEHLPILYSAAGPGDAPRGTASGLFYEWDEKNQQADMAAAIPVAAGTIMENSLIQPVTIPASKAVFVNYYGDYKNEPEAYASIRKYLSENKLKQKLPVIEQYITSPTMEKDTAKWLTKIVFLVE